MADAISSESLEGSPEWCLSRADEEQLSLCNAFQASHETRLNFFRFSPRNLPGITQSPAIFKSSGVHPLSPDSSLFRTMAPQASSPNTTSFATDDFNQNFEAIDQYFACMSLCDREDQDCPNNCLIDHMNFNNNLLHD